MGSEYIEVMPMIASVHQMRNFCKRPSVDDCFCKNFSFDMDAAVNNIFLVYCAKSPVNS